MEPPEEHHALLFNALARPLLPTRSIQFRRMACSAVFLACLFPVDLKGPAIQWSKAQWLCVESLQPILVPSQIFASDIATSDNLPKDTPIPPPNPPTSEGQQLPLFQKFTNALYKNTPELLRPWLELIPPSVRWIAAIVFLAIMCLWQTRKTWSQCGWVQRIRALKRRRPLPHADQFSIAVAHIENDINDDLRTLILDSLRDLRGVQPLRFDRSTTLQQAENLKEVECKAQIQAKEWLRQSGVDILLWGIVLTPTAKQERMVRLYFTCKDSEQHETVRLQEGQVLQLPVAAREPLEAVIRSQVVTRLSAFSASLPVEQDLRREIRHLQAMVKGWPASETRGAMLITLGNALKIVGEQSGKTEPLEQAIAAFQEALKVYTREHQPLIWAGIHNNSAVPAMSETSTITWFQERCFANFAGRNWRSINITY